MGLTHQILTGDSLTLLRTLPSGSVHCVVTSPAYYGQRRYLPAGHEDAVQEIGTEQTPAEYIARLVAVFGEVKRVLRDDGSCWINIGDSFSNGPKSKAEMAGLRSGSTLNGRKGHVDAVAEAQRRTPFIPGIPAKSLLGIPWRLAFALQDDGWILRSEIIWAKGVSGQDALKKRVYEAAIGNGVGEVKARAIAEAVEQYNGSAMPESVTDRCSKTHEQVFMFAKKGRYWWDAEAIADEAATSAHAPGNNFHADKVAGPNDRGGHSQWDDTKARVWGGATRNRRSVWTISPEGTPFAHFATMPTALVEPCILAGCPAQTCPVCGAGWVRIVEKGLTAHDGNTASQYEKGSTAHRMSLLRQAARAAGGEYNSGKQTIGFAPSCTCGATHTVPGVVLDPFAGSGTTLRVARSLGRHAIGIELNPEYVALADRLLAQTQPALLGL